MLRLTKKRAIVAATTVCCLALAAGAFAYFSSTGSGTATATVGTSTGLTLHGTVSGNLYPGAASTVTFTVDNTSTATERVGTISLTKVQPDAFSFDLLDHDHRRKTGLHDGGGRREQNVRPRQWPGSDADRQPDDERNRREPGCLPGRDSDADSGQQLGDALRVAEALGRGCQDRGQDAGDPGRGRPLPRRSRLRGDPPGRRPGRRRDGCRCSRASSSTPMRSPRKRSPNSTSPSRPAPRARSGPGLPLVYECRLDDGAWEVCEGPLSLAGITRGRPPFRGAGGQPLRHRGSGRKLQVAANAERRSRKRAPPSTPPRAPRSPPPRPILRRRRRSNHSSNQPSNPRSNPRPPAFPSRSNRSGPSPTSTPARPRRRSACGSRTRTPSRSRSSP